MKIEMIETFPLRIPYTVDGKSEPAAWGSGNLNATDSLVVKVTTDDGIIGWGETFGFTAIPSVRVAVDKIVGPEYIGRDASQRELAMLEIQKKLHVFGRSGALMYAMSAIDIALWDIAGKSIGQPVYKLLGGSAQTHLPCYASLIRYSDPELVAHNVKRSIDAGYERLKLHEITVEAVAAAREAAGQDVEIMLDVNCPWSVREAIDMAEKFRPFNLRWFEEPVWPPENYSGLAIVRKQGRIPVAAGENASTLMDFQHLLEADSVDFIQPSPAKMGGITELQKVFPLAAAHNATVMVHTFYDGPGLLASVHASAALGGGKSLIEWRSFDLMAQLYGDAIIPKAGHIAVPQGPGLGLEPDMDVIRDYSIDL
ncbi:L-alanine-DL-glutamate epimerase [Burkholderia sp. WP9]|uniref:mandelate racemase/muconate lactonizing enzyme family protein n=1 Tax=Burkholderia sp. WP9 TaxID=1500263 RepID=UPI00089C61F3|nr:mandelate racemase/muconate lactonizing enzyme family protein [Burkholderia sp. WP9]SEF05619.1 L-alanine-DL-glutamate epimerase [Burkholderia sp. WP9]